MITPVLAVMLVSATVHTPAPEAKGPSPVRILLAASAPTREYQFLRNLFNREALNQRVDVSIYLQGTREGAGQFIAEERLLREFPRFLRPLDQDEDKEKEKYLNLSRYDVILAIDLDWTKVGGEQLGLLEEWVRKKGGGLIVVGGPIQTYQLARPAQREKLKTLLDLLPVVLKDRRAVEKVGLGDESWRLNFRGTTADLGFLSLDESRPKSLTAWDEFFAASEKKDGKTAFVRGFYTYYPVERAKETALVLATSSDPLGKLGDGREMPFLVVGSPGKGRVVWLGSAEMWRLRQHQLEYYDRFWTELARYASSSLAHEKDRRSVFYFDRQVTAGQAVEIEAQLFLANQEPVTRKAKPKGKMSPQKDAKLPVVPFELQPVTTEEPWSGWFRGRVPAKQPGQYNLELQVPGTKEVLRGVVTVLPAPKEREEILLQQQRLSLQFREFEVTLLHLVQRLELSDQQLDRTQAKALKQILERRADRGIDAQYGRLLLTLKASPAASLQEIRMVCQQSEELARELRAMVALFPPNQPLEMLQVMMALQAIETGQVQQTEQLTKLRKQREADVLQDLLTSPPGKP